MTFHRAFSSRRRSSSSIFWLLSSSSTCHWDPTGNSESRSQHSEIETCGQTMARTTPMISRNTTGIATMRISVGNHHKPWSNEALVLQTSETHSNWNWTNEVGKRRQSRMDLNPKHGNMMTYIGNSRLAIQNNEPKDLLNPFNIVLERL